MSDGKLAVSEQRTATTHRNGSSHLLREFDGCAAEGLRLQVPLLLRCQLRRVILLAAGALGLLLTSGIRLPVRLAVVLVTLRDGRRSTGSLLGLRRPMFLQPRVDDVKLALVHRHVQRAAEGVALQQARDALHRGLAHHRRTVAQAVCRQRCHGVHARQRQAAAYDQLREGALRGGPGVRVGVVHPLLENVQQHVAGAVGVVRPAAFPVVVVLGVVAVPSGAGRRSGGVLGVIAAGRAQATAHSGTRRRRAGGEWLVRNAQATTRRQHGG